jgi:4-hydroxyacetophenone monooxygenase
MSQTVTSQAGTGFAVPGARVEAFRRAAADEAALRGALAQADIVPQLLAHAQLSGETDLLEEARPFIRGAWSYMAELPPALEDTIRTRLFNTLEACALGAESARPSRAIFGHIMSVGIGQPIPDDYVDMMLEELDQDDVDARRVHWRGPGPEGAADCHVVIVGAGLSGLCMAIKLKEAGIPFVILEKNDAVGGTWFENSYPGCGVDIPNHFYSFSFALKHDWSRHFAKRDELWAYLDQLADAYDIRRHIQFGKEVAGARFNEATSRWEISVRDAAGCEEMVIGNVFVPAVGQLNRPAIPDVPGLADFKGPVFHTAAWDHGVDLSGKRVALFGTGASSMQVGPSIVDRVGRLLVFQRSRHWALAHPLYHVEVNAGMKWALEHVPYLARWHRFLLFWASGDVLHAMLEVDPDWKTPDISLNAENHAFRQRLLTHLEAELAGRPDLLEKVIPNYPPYGKRMLRDNGWFKMLKRDHVDLVTDGVERVEADAIVDRTGRRHEVDVIVLATGFQASRMLWPMEIVGRGGTTLASVWKDDDPRAFLGITVPRFPNMFVLFGPNTALSHGGSMFFQAECQVRYVMQCIRELIERDQAAIECRPEPHEEYARRIDSAHSRMVWAHPNVKSWYKNASGRVTTLSPWRLVDYWTLTHALNPADYRFTPRGGQDAEVGR